MARDGGSAMAIDAGDAPAPEQAAGGAAERSSAPPSTVYTRDPKLALGELYSSLAWVSLGCVWSQRVSL